MMAQDDQRMVSVADYLSEVGDRCSCHFTLEYLEGTKERPSPFQAAVPALADADAPTIDLLISFLQERLVGFDVFANEHRPNVFHVIESTLAGDSDYALTRKVSLRYSGVLAGLPAAIGRHVPEIRGRTGGGNLDFFDDTQTQATIEVTEVSVRDILTMAVPLDDYSRVLWTAATRKRAREVRTVLQFSGVRPASIAE